MGIFGQDRVTEEDRAEWEAKTFGTTTPELLELHDWLLEWSSTHVALCGMEFMGFLRDHSENALVGAIGVGRTSSASKPADLLTNCRPYDTMSNVLQMTKY